MSHWIPVLSCKNPNCLGGKTIFLPYPNPPEITASQPDWPKADWHIFLVCPWCGLGYEYTKHDVRWGGDGTRTPLQNNSLQRIQLKCGGKGCTSPVELYIPEDAATTTQDRDRRIATGSHNAR